MHPSKTWSLLQYWCGLAARFYASQRPQGPTNEMRAKCSIRGSRLKSSFVDNLQVIYEVTVIAAQVATEGVNRSSEIVGCKLPVRMFGGIGLRNTEGGFKICKFHRLSPGGVHPEYPE